MQACETHIDTHADSMHLHIHTLWGRFIISKMTFLQSSAPVIALPCNFISGKLKTDCTGVSLLPSTTHTRTHTHTHTHTCTHNVNIEM